MQSRTQVPYIKFSDSYFPKICLHSLHPVGVAARPPSAVSLREDGIDCPISFIEWMTSSVGIALVIPAQAC